MKFSPFFTYTALCLLTLVTSAFAEFKQRRWTTFDGVSKNLKFEEFKQGKILCKDAEQKDHIIDVSTLSYTDRVYLMDHAKVPKEELLGGFIPDEDLEMELSKGNVSKLPSIEFGKKGKYKLRVLQSPNFEIWYERGVSVDSMMEQVEKVWLHLDAVMPSIRQGQKKRKNLIVVTESPEYYQAYRSWAETRDRSLSEFKYDDSPEKEPVALFGTANPLFNELDRPVKSSAFLVYTGVTPYTEPEGELYFIDSYSRYLAIVSYNSGVFHWNGGRGRNLCFGVGFHAQDYLTGLFDVGFHAEGERTTGQFGKRKRWTKVIAKAVKKGDVNISIEEIFADKITVKGDDMYSLIVLSYMRYINSSAEMKLNTVKYYQLLADVRKGEERFAEFPSVEDIVKCYGHDTVSAMEEAFKEFILGDNLK